MPYPFPSKLKNLELTSYQLKVLAVASGTTIPEVLRWIVGNAFHNYDPEKIKEAQAKVGKPR